MSWVKAKNHLIHPASFWRTVLFAPLNLFTWKFFFFFFSNFCIICVVLVSSTPFISSRCEQFASCCFSMANLGGQFNA